MARGHRRGAGGPAVHRGAVRTDGPVAPGPRLVLLGGRRGRAGGRFRAWRPGGPIRSNPMTQVSNPVFARIFPLMSRAMEAGGIAARRGELLSGRLRRLASAAARTAPVPVEVTGGLAGVLPADDASFDAAVVCYVLCTVPDQDMALAEVRRVLR